MDYQRAKQVAMTAAKALEDKKGIQVDVLDISATSPLTDFFVIASGTSVTHIKALADEVGEQLSKEGVFHLHCEGYSSGRWILLDFGEVVVHVFHQEDRAFYNIERLWSTGNRRGADEKAVSQQYTQKNEEML